MSCGLTRSPFGCFPNAPARLKVLKAGWWSHTSGLTAVPGVYVERGVGKGVYLLPVEFQGKGTTQPHPR